MTAPVRSRIRAQAFVHLGLLATLLVATVAMSISRPAGADAQSATPVATAPATSVPGCDSPALVPAPDVPGTVTGSPSATPAPVVAVDQQTSDAIDALVASLAACLTNGNAQSVAELVTDRYLGDAYGGDRKSVV